MSVNIKKKKSAINLQIQKSLLLDSAYSDLIENRSFQFLFQYTSDMVFIFNLQKEVFTAVNKAALQKTKSEASQWTNRSLNDTPLSGSQVQIFQDVLKKLHFEYFIFDREINSPLKPLQKLALDAMNLNGMAIILLKERVPSNEKDIDTDFVREMKNSPELLQTEKMASIGRLASGIAHELRNPLTIISATAQFSLEKLELNPKIKEHFETIYRNVNNANRIVREMLDYAKPRELKLKQDNINNIILRTIELIKLEIRKQKIQLRVELDKNVPEFYVDSKHLEQTFLNIILNAIHAIPDKGHITISTRFESANQQVTIDIEDNGDGIPEEILEKIFDPFYTTRSGGTGLGLSICQNIVHAHGGQIHVNSEPKNGATFSISLPINKNPETEGAL